VLTIARDYRQSGVDAVMLAEKFINGTSIEYIPFQYVSKTIFTLNKSLANLYHLQLSPEVLESADKIIE